MRQEPITKHEIRELLLERNLFSAVSGDLSDDTQLHMDSLTLVWFVNGLEQRCGVALRFDDREWSEFGSVNAIHQLLLRKCGETEEAEEAGRT